MAVVSPGAMRSRMDEGVEGLTIIIPARRPIFPLLFLPVWLVGWTVGGVRTLTDLRNAGSAGFPTLWLAAWMIGGGWAIGTLLWMLVGRERIVAGSGMLLHRREIFGKGITREYEVSTIRNLRVSPQPSSYWSRDDQYGLRGGIIAFDYGAKTVRFGASIDEAEGKTLVDQLSGRLRLPSRAV